MRILVIPDVHLKPKMFADGAALLRAGEADRAVCLMDLADDWNQQFNIPLYEETYDAALSFAEKFPDTLWCCGNHDIAYQWQQGVSGQSVRATRTVCEKLDILKEIAGESLGFVHVADKVMFSHGGVCQAFVNEYIPEPETKTPADIAAEINQLGYSQLWQDLSSLWYRPQYGEPMYLPDSLLQVAGHTPFEEITEIGGVVYCDLFSAHPDGHPVGARQWLVVDTDSLDCRIINRD